MRCAPLAALLLAACAPAAPPRSPSAASLPYRALGVSVRKPLDPAAFTRRRCITGRQFAFIRGHYSVVSDDVLVGSPHEHEDSAAVLAALDSFTVCIGQTRELNATAIVTLDDSLVSNATIFWEDEAQAPDYSRMLGLLVPVMGQPLKNPYGVQYWSADSMTLHVSRMGPYNDATTLTLSDSRACNRFERLVHRDHPAPQYVKENGDPDPGSNYCWVAHE